MIESKLLIVDEDELVQFGSMKILRGKDNMQKLYTASHVIIRKNDGSLEVWKDRWQSAGNRTVKIFIPGEDDA